MASILSVGKILTNIVIISIVIIVIISINHHLALSSFAKRLAIIIKKLKTCLFLGVHGTFKFISTEPY